jgi:hypothetical protein
MSERIIWYCVVVFAFIYYAIHEYGWWLAVIVLLVTFAYLMLFNAGGVGS